MTDTTIADISREKVVLNNTEWFEGQDGTGSFKSHVGSIRGFGTVPVTTSGVSQDVGPYPQLIVVTTSGSGLGTDLLNIVNPTLDANGVNADLIGQSIIVAVPALADPADAVTISVAGVSNFLVAVNVREGSLTLAYTGVKLDFAGAVVCLRWVGSAWYVDAAVGQFSTVGEVSVNTVQPLQAGNPVFVIGGDGDVATDGGVAKLAGGGVASGTHAGGPASLRGQCGGLWTGRQC
jgi:hypothetical protein